MNVSSTRLVVKMDNLVEHFRYKLREDVSDNEESLDEPLGLNVAGHGLMHSRGAV